MSRSAKASKAKMECAIRKTARIMEEVAKTTLPLRKDVRRFLEQHAKWLREQLKS